ncbi:MAG: LLM class F420-dependent oxidoreductase [Candidatus Bipolaricaulia bacterium]
MQFGICIPHYGKPVNIEQILEVARRAEELGFDSIWVTDHLLVPRTFDIIYRDNMLEPIALLSHLAAVTRRVKLGTSVIILPYRHPVVVAKMMATIDQLSGGRLIFGAAVGWMEEEFVALGRPYGERGAMSDENLHLIRELWTNEVVSFTGTYSRLQDMQTSPRPVQQPYPPIWIGGNSRRARRRVAELGDGWHAVRIDPATVSKGRKDLQVLWDKNKRPGSPTLSIRILLFLEGVSKEILSYPARSTGSLTGSVQQIIDIIGQYQEVGIEHMVFELSTQSHESILHTLETFASKIKSQFTGEMQRP